jgi:hypothetical protein
MKYNRLFFTFYIMILFSCSQKSIENESLIAIKIFEKKNQKEISKHVKNLTKIESNNEFKKDKLPENVKNPFNDLNYDKVVAYDYEGGKNLAGIEIITEGKLLPFSKKVVLSKFQINELINCLTANSTYGEGKAACFNPHFGIVFYSNDEVAAHISICFECNYLVSSVVISAMKQKIISISDDYSYYADGFSEKGKEKLIKLCSELKFSHCNNEIE